MRPSFFRARVIGPASVLFCFLLLLHLLYFVDQHAVNILFYDQWDYFRALVEGKGFWELFRWQHGPHRMGIGFLLTEFIATLSGWNSRVEALASTFGIFIAALLFLALKNRLVPQTSGWDLLLCAKVLSLAAWESLLGVANISHAVLPLCLLAGGAWAWTVPSSALRYGMIFLLNALLLYTGFGFFACPVAIVLLMFDAKQVASRPAGEKWMWGLTLFALLLVLASFFIGYTHQPAVECYRFPPDAKMLRDFLPFLGAAWAFVFGVQWYTPLGIALGLGLFVVFVFWTLRLFTVEEKAQLSPRALQYLALYSLLFIGASALGRVCLGVRAAYTSRYYLLLLPAWIAIFLWVRSRSFHGQTQRLLLGGLLLGFLLQGAFLQFHQLPKVKHYLAQREAWKRCYLMREDVAACNTATGFHVHPLSEVSPTFAQVMDYLKKHHLNLYLPERKS